MMWTKIPEKSSEHWAEFRDPEGRYGATVKWDGCIEVSRAVEVRFALHICDLDDHIARLQALRAAVVQHFGEGWPW